MNLILAVAIATIGAFHDMNYLDAKKELVEITGHPELVLDSAGGDFSDHTVPERPKAKTYLNKANRRIEESLVELQAEESATQSVAIGQYVIDVPGHRYVSRIDLLTADLKYSSPLQLKTIGWLRDRYGKRFDQVEHGRPKYWAKPVRGENATQTIEFQSVVATAGDADGQVLYANGSAYSDGRIYVADYGNSRVNIYDVAGNLVQSFGGEGTGDGEFTFLSGIAVGAGMIFAADRPGSSGRIQAFTLDGEYLSDYTLSGAAFGSLFFSDNQIYATKVVGTTYTVVVFNTALSPVRSWGTAGTANGQFDDVVSVMVYDGEVYTCHSDTSTRRVQVWTTTGTFVRAWNFAVANTASPIGICEIDGNIAVSYDLVALGPSQGLIRLFTTTGTLIRDMVLTEQPASLYCYVHQSDGVVIVTAYGGDGVLDDDPSVGGVYRYSIDEVLSGLVIMPPADEAYTASVFGGYYAHAFDDDTDETWVSSNCSNALLLMAKAYVSLLVEGDSKTFKELETQALREASEVWANSIHEQIEGIPLEEQRFGPISFGPYAGNTGEAPMYQWDDA